MPSKSAAKIKSASHVRSPVDGDVVSTGATRPTRTSQARGKRIRSDASTQPTPLVVEPTAESFATGPSSPSSPNPVASKTRDRAAVPTEAQTVPETVGSSGADQQSAAPALGLSKAQRVLTLLRGDQGATLLELQAATGWQAHSVRGFLSGTIRKRMGLALTSQLNEAGARRYALAKG